MSEGIEKERPKVSIIIPTYNEQGSIQKTLEAIPRVRRDSEMIVVDGGSTDETTVVARRSGARVISSERGRGIQMHNGALMARGDALLFLHADTILPPTAVDLIVDTLARDPLTVGGNFGIQFDGNSRAARLMTWLYPRLEKLGLCYGDSGIFVRTAIYSEIGGFNRLPLFEDVDLVSRLKRRGRFRRLPIAVITSSRRFEGRSFPFTFARWLGRTSIPRLKLGENERLRPSSLSPNTRDHSKIEYRSESQRPKTQDSWRSTTQLVVWLRPPRHAA
jgi:rSAM/selenodomain-associated transferase 2